LILRHSYLRYGLAKIHTIGRLAPRWKDLHYQHTHFSVGPIQGTRLIIT
jgi:hypothetical protein